MGLSPTFGRVFKSVHAILSAMCYSTRVVEIDGVKYLQFLDYDGEVEFQHPITEPVKVQEPEPVPEPMIVRPTRRKARK